MIKEGAFITEVKCRNACRKAGYTASLGVFGTRLWLFLKEKKSNCWKEIRNGDESCGHNCFLDVGVLFSILGKSSLLYIPLEKKRAYFIIYLHTIHFALDSEKTWQLL